MTATRPTAPPLPRRLQVEVTASCNLRCRMCIVRYRPALPRSASMDLATFTSLAASLPDLEEVVLQGIGEPLLAPDLYEMIGWATGRGIRTRFNTNATLLTPRAGRRLIEAGLSALHISIDAADAATYEHIRGGASWETVERNVSAFVAQRCRLGVDRPHLSLVMVLMARNLDQVEAVVRQAAAWGIGEVFVQGLSHDFSDASDDFPAIREYIEGESLARLPVERVASAFARGETAAAELGVTLRLPALQPRPGPVHLDDGTPVGCDWPWQGGYVSRDGTVLPCCMVMGEGRIAFGNVNERPYSDIWESEPFQAFREGLLNGNPHPVCAGCSLYKGTF